MNSYKEFVKDMQGCQLGGCTMRRVSVCQAQGKLKSAWRDVAFLHRAARRPHYPLKNKTSFSPLQVFPLNILHTAVVPWRMEEGRSHNEYPAIVRNVRNYSNGVHNAQDEMKNCADAPYILDGFPREEDEKKDGRERAILLRKHSDWSV